MKTSSFFDPIKTPLAITVCEDGRVVYADPLSRSLFGREAPPTLPKGVDSALISLGGHSHLCVCRPFFLHGRSYTLYATLPLDGNGDAFVAELSRLAHEALDALCDRFSLVLRQTHEDAPGILPLFPYFRALADEISASLYAPLRVELASQMPSASVCVHRVGLSRAIGVALAALLVEGQSAFIARLSTEGDLTLLSFDGDRAVGSPFLRVILDELAARSGFSVRHTERGISFLLSSARTPAASLRDEDEEDALHLLEGYRLLFS